ncbi:MAG: hypothetical protein HYY06_09015 [Deltaproteobacteria bacterium]|nr:hypothetical protein [Deltaproteobacteria bacterium]
MGVLSRAREASGPPEAAPRPCEPWHAGARGRRAAAGPPKPRASCVHFAALIAGALGSAACSDWRTDSTHSTETTESTKRIELPPTTDPAVLAGAVRNAAAGGCGDLAATLAALGARATEGRPRLRSRELRGLVDDALDAASGACRGNAARATLASARGPAVALARSEVSGADQAAALASLERAHDDVAAIRFRRAELHERAGRTDEAARELRRGLELEDDPDARAALARLEVVRGRPEAALRLLAAAQGSGHEAIAEARTAALAAAGRDADVVLEVSRAPIDLRPELARAAARAAAAPDRLAQAGRGSSEILRALADRARGEGGPAASARLLAGAAALEPRDAALAQTLAQDLAAAGDLDGAIDAWDRAAALAPAAERPCLEPIALLVGAGRSSDARARSEALARAARSGGDADALARASAGAAAAGDRALALALAREAQGARPSDGRLASILADRLEEAGKHSEALEALVRLFVCGAHGRPWHRHDLARRLAALARSSGQADALEARLRAAPSESRCTPTRPDELAQMAGAIVASLRPPK